VPCGLLPADCITDHWCPPLSARREPAGWRAPCPVCGSPRGLSIQVKGRYPAWNLHCKCDRADVQPELDTLVPCRSSSGRRAKKSAPDPDELMAIITDKSIPPNALRVALLRCYGMSAAEIRFMLGLPKSTYYDTVRILGLNRRSALVRILGLFRIGVLVRILGLNRRSAAHEASLTGVWYDVLSWSRRRRADG
jgi:hypothetical protein